MTEPLLTVDDLATLLRLTPRAIYNRVHRNDGTVPPPTRIGRLLRWAVEDVNQWQEQHRDPIDQ